MRYVVGFLFNPDHTKIALIRKNKPDWQKGLLNGIGGKIEPSDPDAYAAMTREFEEEAGIVVATWTHFAKMQGIGWEVECFCAAAYLEPIQSKTDEQIEIVDLPLKGADVIENLPWLIPLAEDVMKDKRPLFTLIQYPS